MCCDEELLRRNNPIVATTTTTSITQRPTTMEGNGNASTRSLLVDYSKHRARPEELKEADVLLPNTIHVSSVEHRGHSSFACLDESEKSFGPPELHPMSSSSGGSSSRLCCYLPSNSNSKSRDVKAMRMLGASADTIEMEGDDSFACDKPLEDLLSPVRSPTVIRAAPRNRRMGNRRTHSLTKLRENLDESDPHHYAEEEEEESLRFSLRRRPSQTNRNDKTKTPPGRSKTWDPSAHNNDDDVVPGRSWGAMFDAIDASHHSMNSPKSKEITPENRRRMLVRHSSVSALEISTRPFGGMTPAASIDMSMPAVGSTSTRRSGMTRQSSLRGAPMARQSSLRGIMAPPRSPKRNDESEVLPDTIEIKPKDPTKKTTKKKKKQISLDNHFRRHSSHNDNSNKKTSNTSIASRSAFTSALGRTSLHSLVGAADAMSVSDKSHFTTGRCPSTRNAPPSRQLNMSGGGNGNRRDLLRRSLSSRRHLKGEPNAMEDTSQFVTGSRIRRCSGRELLGC
jgi:hypothetical protein